MDPFRNNQALMPQMQNPQQFNPNNPLFNNMFGGFANFQNQLNQLTQQIQQAQQSPQAMVQQMLNSGQITQQQFEQARQIANQLTGMNL